MHNVHITQTDIVHFSYALHNEKNFDVKKDKKTGKFKKKIHKNGQKS